MISKPFGTRRRTSHPCCIAVERVIRRREQTQTPSAAKQRKRPKGENVFIISLCLCFSCNIIANENKSQDKICNSRTKTQNHSIKFVTVETNTKSWDKSL